MKRTWLKVVVGFLTLVLLMGTGTAAWAKATKAEIEQRLVAEKAAIAQRYAQSDLERQAAVRALAVKPAMSEDRGLPSPIKTAFLTPFVTVGTGLVALGEGFNYVTKSKFETLISQACRAGNTMKSQMLYHPINVVTEFFTGFTGNTQYYNPTKLNWLGERAKKRGPISQMAEMAGTVIPPTMVATGVTAPFLGLTFGEMFIVDGAISAVGSIGVGEAFDAAEKGLIK
jgi:hypothetical protein